MKLLLWGVFQVWGLGLSLQLWVRVASNGARGWHWIRKWVSVYPCEAVPWAYQIYARRFLVGRRRIAVFSLWGAIGFMGCDWLCSRLGVFWRFVIAFFFVWLEYVREVFRKRVAFIFVALRPTVLRLSLYAGGICWYRFPCCFDWLPCWVVVEIQFL
jgi:hypothetical protein